MKYLFDSDLQKQADEWGIDLSMLVRNLELSNEERVDQHSHALELVLELEKAREQLNK